MKQLKKEIKWKINVKWSTLHSYHSCVRGASIGYGLDGRGWIPHNVQNGSGAHPVSYPVSTGGSF
jgi:hypothetical protein